MSRLPKGWTEVRLGEVLVAVPNIKPEDCPDQEFGYVDISSIDNKSFKIIEAKKIFCKNAPSRARRPIQANDVLFSNVRTYLRNIALVLPETQAEVCSTGFTVLRPSTAIDPRYLFRYVLTDAFIDKVTPQQTGTHYPATSDRVVLSEIIPLPPLNEQRRIVAKLEAVLGKVDACQQRLAKIPVILKRFRQAVLAAACSGRLTADWREENESAAQEISANSQDFPYSWNAFAFGDLYSLIDGDRGPNYPKQHDYYPSGHCLFLSTKNVRPFGFLFDETIFISEKKHQELRNGTLKRGDVIITTRGTLGNVAVYDDSVPYSIVRINSGMLIIRSKRSDVVTQFLKIFIGSPLFSTQLSEKQTGSAQPQIPAGILKTFITPVPSLPEQHEIVRRVEALFTLADQLEARYLKAKAHVDRLTQSILAKAFRGELVPQDENDEPAAALLERVRAQRSQAVQVGRHPAPQRSPRTPRTRRTAKPAALPLVAETPANYGRNIPQAILAHMQSGTEYSRADITDALGLSTSDWSWAIRQLKEEGKVVQTGERRGARYKVTS